MSKRSGRESMYTAFASLCSREYSVYKLVLVMKADNMGGWSGL